MIEIIDQDIFTNKLYYIKNTIDLCELNMKIGYEKILENDNIRTM